MSQNLRAFISGPLEPPALYFETHYAPRIDEAIDQGHHFILGPSRGIDSLTLSYLSSRGVSAERVKVFVMQSESTKPNIMRRFEALKKAGGEIIVRGKTHTERDAACTRASDFDILRWVTEEECRALYGAKYRARVSGTQLNEIRRTEWVAKPKKRSSTLMVHKEASLDK